VGTCFSGEGAVETAVKLRPDLVLMDIVLGGKIDGIEAARQILEKINCPSIYLTAYADQETLPRALATHPVGYVLKPFDTRTLRVAIELGLANRAKKLVDGESYPRVSTGLQWLDHVLGGGLPAQSLVVVAGAPGSGKSVLVLHLMAEAIRRGGNALLVTTTHQPATKLSAQYGNLSFLGPAGVLDRLECFDLDLTLQSQNLSGLLNTIVGRAQEKGVEIAAIDSFRAISDMAQSRAQVWSFLRTLSAQLWEHNFLGVLVGEYLLPRDLDLPEFAMADAVIYLEMERLTSSDLRTLRVYKMRGGRYVEGRQAFHIDDDGIHFIGAYQRQTAESGEGR
jgi:KaiC/GvpD/RAD55 family RecA-like ATPase/CheY-like chemotaxis protein